MEVRLGVRKEGRKRDIDTYEFELAYELLGRASISSMLPSDTRRLCVCLLQCGGGIKVGCGPCSGLCGWGCRL